MDNETLIERLEKAESRNGDLNVAIFKLLNPEYASDDWRPYGGGLRHRNDSSDMRTQPKPQIADYTGSVDAALTLIPDGWEWSVDWCGNSIAKMRRLPDGPEVKAYGPAPAIAICIAALRARSGENT